MHRTSHRLQKIFAIDVGKYLLLAGATLLAAGCASLVDKGDDLYKRGLYTEAADFYARAVAQDPNDTKAREGLFKARYMIIDRGLIEVRMLRIASNYTGAADKLEKILEDQQSWSMEITGAAASDEADEIGYAGTWLEKEAASLSKTRFPDKFRAFRLSYKLLIQNARLDSKFEQYQPGLNTLGKAECKKLAANVSGQRFFLRDFVQQYCTAWGEQVSLHVDPTDQARYRGVDSNIQVRFNTNTNSSQMSTLKSQLDHLSDQFRKSLWYSNIGEKNLNMNVIGNVQYSVKQQRIIKDARYFTKEKVVQADGTTAQKMVEHTFRYPVIEYHENYIARLNYSANQNSLPLHYDLDKSVSNTSEENNATFKPARVYPNKAKMMSVDAALNGLANAANAQIIKKLDGIWSDSYCGQGLGSHHGEYILRCGKINPDNRYVNNWFTETFGVDYKTMANLYGL